MNWKGTEYGRRGPLPEEAIVERLMHLMGDHMQKLSEGAKGEVGKFEGQKVAIVTILKIERHEGDEEPLMIVSHAPDFPKNPEITRLGLELARTLCVQGFTAYEIALKQMGEGD